MSESPSRRELIVTGAVAGFVTLIAAIAFYGTDIATGASLFFTHDISGSDLWHLNYPMKHFLQQELEAGRFPLWCDAIGTGFPLHAEGQIAALYPPNILLYRLLPLPLAFNWSILLHVALAGGFAAMFARQLGALRSASIVAAIVFALSGFFVTHVKHLNMTASAVWIPLLLVLLERYAARRSSATLIAIALTVAMTVLGGHPQIAYQNLLIGGLYGLWLLVRTWRAAGGGATLRTGAGLLWAVALGILSTLPQVLPTRELNAVGPRAEGMTFAQATQWEYQWKHLGAFAVPGAFGDPARLGETAARDRAGRPLLAPDNSTLTMASGGFRQDPGRPMLYWEMTAYAGLLPLVLLIVALALGWRHRGVLVAFALLALSILLALGKNGGLLNVFWHVVPGFKLFRFHDRYLLYADLAIAVLAALAITLLAARFLTGARAKYALGIAVALGVFCWGDLFQALAHHNPKVATPRWTEAPKTVVAIRQDAGDDPAPYRVVSTDLARQVFLNAYNRARGWSGDLAPYDVARESLDPNYNLLFGIDMLHVYYQLYPDWMQQVANRYFAPADPTPGFALAAGAERIGDLYNVRYAIAPRGAAFDDPARNPALGALANDTEIARVDGDVFEGVATFDANRRASWAPFDIRVYRNPAARPRAFLVPSARIVRDAAPVADAFPPALRTNAKAMLARGAPLQSVVAQTRVPAATLVAWRNDAIGADVAAVLAPDFDPAREVVVLADGDAAPAPGEAGEPIDAPVAIERVSPQHVRLTANAPRACWLFLAETWYPGWEATVNGEPATIWRGNGAGRAVAVPAGPVEVVFRFAPASFALGGWIALIALIALGATPLFARRVGLA